MKFIILSNGRPVRVDNDKHEELSKYKWQDNGKGYAKSGDVYMHHLITGWKYVDHKSGDVFDNRLCNLRKSSPQTNQYNRSKNKNNTSGFKGVFRASNSKTFRARIRVNKKQIHLGSFKTAKQAHEAYCSAAKKYHGEFFRGE